MPTTYETGDLFELALPAIGHGCNCQGSMGAGIAREFRRRYPVMYDEYRRKCRRGAFQLGDVFTWEEDGLVIYNLATQPRPGPPASLNAIRRSVAAALADAEGRGLASVGVPRLGAGLGGLHWPDVAETLDEVGESSPVELVVVSLPEAAVS